MIRTTILNVSFTSDFVQEKFSESAGDSEAVAIQKGELVQKLRSLLRMSNGTVEIDSLSMFPLSVSLAVYHDKLATAALEAEYRELLKDLPVRSVSASGQDTYYGIPPNHVHIIDSESRWHLAASISTHTTLWLEPIGVTPCQYTAWVLHLKWDRDLTIRRLERARYAPDFSGGRLPRQIAALARLQLHEHANVESACRAALRKLRGALGNEELQWAT